MLHALQSRPMVSENDLRGLAESDRKPQRLAIRQHCYWALMLLRTERVSKSAGVNRDLRSSNHWFGVSAITGRELNSLGYPL
jgi:hypothetical protein